MPRITALTSSKSAQTVTIRDSNNEKVSSHDPAEILAFLNEADDDTIYVVWDMSRFLKPIFDILPSDTVEAIKNGGKTHWREFKLFYGIGKGQVFGITQKSRKQIAGNFYSEDTYENNIYDLKTFYPNEQMQPTLEHIKILANNLIVTLKEMGIRPSNGLLSPANILEHSILSHMNIPTIYHLDDIGINCAYYCEQDLTEWVTTYNKLKGKWYEYDITAAYPYEIARLPNLFFAEFTHQTVIPLNAYWGIFKGNFEVSKKINPFSEKDSELYLTTDEIDCIYRWKLGKFFIIDGYTFSLKKEYYPFKYLIDKLYHYRYQLPLKDYLAKIMANSIEGKFLERHGEEFGNLYNPIYARMIIGRTKVKVCDFIYSHNLDNDVLSIQVDNVSSAKKVDGISNKKAFGEWRLT